MTRRPLLSNGAGRPGRMVAVVSFVALAGVTGYVLLRVLASGAFVSIALSGASHNGGLIGSDPQAFGGKYLQFTPATPTPTSQPATASSGPCLPKPSACGYPDATNTGVPAGTQLASHPGSQTIKADNTVINGWDTGRINIYANNVIIKNSRITTSAYYGVYVYSGSVTVEDTTIVGQATASAECDAGLSGVTLALRVNISGCEDGAHLSGSQVIQDSYIHDPYFTSSSHNDGVQVFSGVSGIKIVHNTIVMTGGTGTVKSANSCIFVQPTSSSVDGLIVDRNLVDGGGYCLYIEQSSNVTLSNNRVGRDYHYGWFSRAHNTNTPTLVGNIWDDTGLPTS